MFFKWASSSYRALHRSPPASSQSAQQQSVIHSDRAVQFRWIDRVEEEAMGRERHETCVAGTTLPTAILCTCIGSAGRSSSSAAAAAVAEYDHHWANRVCVWLIKSAYEFMFQSVFFPSPSTPPLLAIPSTTIHPSVRSVLYV